MILRNMSYEEFAKYVIDTEKRIVVYGAGMIGKILVPYILEKYGIEKFVDYYVDMDSRKTGQEIELYSSKVPICLPDKLKEIGRTILLISNSNFESIVYTLDGQEYLNSTEAVILPVMQLRYLLQKEEESIVQTSQVPLIPKKIHYCWFSKNPIPDNLKRCMESWKKFCPDYEIIRWDEDNYDFEKIPYMKDAYARKKWGFVPDYARLDIIFREGGIYLDTDVELIRGLDELLYQPAFCGVEKWGNINTGGCFGAIKGHSFVKELRDFRAEVPFVMKDGSMNLETCGYYETMPFIQKGMKVDGTVQIIENMTVYSSDFFHPYDYMSEEITITPNTFSIHHFNGGWLNEDAIEQRENTQKKYKELLERMKR